MGMTSMLQRFFVESPVLAVAVAFWAGAVASLNPYTMLRLPIVVGCVAGVGASRRQSLAVALIFTLGLIVSYVVLGLVIAFGSIPIDDILKANKYIYWLFGAALVAAGMWVGFVGHSCRRDQESHETPNLGKALITGLFLLGVACGLPLIPIGSSSGLGLLVLARGVAGHGFAWSGLPTFLSFGLGQSMPVLAMGVLTGLVKPPLIRRLRPRLCSIEQQVRLLAGNGLMVLGIYFAIVG